MNYELNVATIHNNLRESSYLLKTESGTYFINSFLNKIASLLKRKGITVNKKDIPQQNYGIYDLSSYEELKTIPFYCSKMKLSLNSSFKDYDTNRQYFDLTSDLIVSPNDEEYPILFLYSLITYRDDYTLDKYVKFQFNKCLIHDLDLNYLLKIAKSEKKDLISSLRKFQVSNIKIAKKILSNLDSNTLLVDLPIKDSHPDFTDKQWALMTNYVLEWLEIDKNNISKKDMALVGHLLARKPITTRIQNYDLYKKYNSELKDKKLKLKYLREIKEYFMSFKHKDIVQLVEKDIAHLKETIKKNKV